MGQNKKRAQKKKVIFVHKVNVFDGDLLVCVGIKDAKDIGEFLKKKIINKEAKNWLKTEDLNELNEVIKSCSGMVYRKPNEAGQQTYLMWLKSFDNNWDDYQILIHEIVHYKQFQFEDKRIGAEEKECEAYFIESMFRDLRNAINKKLQ